MTPPPKLDRRAALLAVGEATFARNVLAAPLPVMVCFGARACQASAALRPLLRELAAAYAGRLRIATVDAERDVLLAEQAGVPATPTLIVVQGGEILTRAVGFMPAGLVRRLCEQAAAGALPPEPFWSPTEETFEDAVVVPLLESWGFAYVRQANCPAPARGRIDMLIYERQSAEPLTLFENKRRLASALALRHAVDQAHTYARTLCLPSFVVAAPAGLWIYRCSGTRAAEVCRITSLELQQRPGIVPQILRQLRL